MVSRTCVTSSGPPGMGLLALFAGVENCVTYDAGLRVGNSIKEGLQWPHEFVANESTAKAQ